MAVKIRLRRMGTRGKPFYRMVVADSRSPRDGRFIEIIGHYDPRTEPPTLKINEEKALYWLERGAQPSDTVEALLKKENIFQKFLASKEKPAKKSSAPAAEVAAPAEEVTEEPKKKAAPKKKATTVSASAKPKAAKVEEAAPAAEPEAVAEEVVETTEPETIAESAAVVEEQPTEEQG